MKELEEYPATAGVTEDEKREYARKNWRSFGAMGKQHNVVKYIRGSPQSREGYSIIRDIRDEPQKTAEKKMKVPVMNNYTKWGECHGYGRTCRIR